jgi:hypothetical protein
MTQTEGVDWGVNTTLILARDAADIWMNVMIS